jgi:hypothetical protein
MVRNIISSLLGVLAGIFIIFLLEVLSHIIYPLPQGIDINDHEAIKAFTSSAPAVIFILLIVSYAIGSLIGGMVASLIATVN